MYKPLSNHFPSSKTPELHYMRKHMFTNSHMRGMQKKKSKYKSKHTQRKKNETTSADFEHVRDIFISYFSPLFRCCCFCCRSFCSNRIDFTSNVAKIRISNSANEQKTRKITLHAAHVQQILDAIWLWHAYGRLPCLISCTLERQNYK